MPQRPAPELLSRETLDRWALTDRDAGLIYLALVTYVTQVHGSPEERPGAAKLALLDEIRHLLERVDSFTDAMALAGGWQLDRSRRG